MESIASFALLIALWSLFSGFTQVVHAVALRVVYSQWWVLLLSGIVGVVFGLAAISYYPGLSLAFAVVLVAWWLLVTGAVAIAAAVMERKLGLAWAWTLAFGILSVVAGAYAIMTPPATLAAIMGLIAGFAIVTGVVHLMAAYKLASVKAQLGDALHGARA
jgi:uncharacterized membrane protein HdeD (DUF308 family)